MKINYKIDFAAKAAAFYTTFPQPENSQRIISRNNRNIIAIADHVAQKISSQSIQKSQQTMVGNSLNIFA